VVRVPEDPRATSMQIHFGGSDVVAYLCQLDAEPEVECTPPFVQLTMLQPGSHSFTVTPSETGVCLDSPSDWADTPSRHC
jgi:hypothetical protein